MAQQLLLQDPVGVERPRGERENHASPAEERHAQTGRFEKHADVGRVAKPEDPILQIAPRHFEAPEELELALQTGVRAGVQRGTRDHQTEPYEYGIHDLLIDSDAGKRSGCSCSL